MGATCAKKTKVVKLRTVKSYAELRNSSPRTKVLVQSTGTPATQNSVAEAQAPIPEPATAEAVESKEPEATSDAAAATDKTVTSVVAAVRKPRIIKEPVVHEDPTIYLKTWTGDSE